MVWKSVFPPAGEIECAKCAAVRDQRNAADGLNSFRAERANDFVVETIDLGTAGEQWLAGGEAHSGRRCFQRNGDFLIEKTGAAGKIQRVNLQKARCGFAKGKTGVVVVNDFFERGNNATEKLGQLARGNEYVVDLEQNLEPVALAGQLDLISLRSLVIERVIHGHGNL